MIMYTNPSQLSEIPITIQCYYDFEHPLVK